jgi:hypothetical protein
MVIVAFSVLVLKDFLVHYVIVGFVGLINQTCFNEVVFLELELS